jgi:hypothetical protein
MRVVIDFHEVTLNKVKPYLKNTTLANFINTAIENQLALEEMPFDERDQVTILNDIAHTQVSLNLPTSENPQEPKKFIRPASELIKHQINYESLPFEEAKLPLSDKYIWGQYSKFFPVKVVLRCLGRLSINQNQVKLKDLQNYAYAEAVKIKQALEENDKNSDRKRGERFSAGLPDSNEKSKNRFVNHFIGYQTANGDNVGILLSLGFVSITGGNIKMTNLGLNFCRLYNPILDAGEDSSVLFGPEEIDYLLTHLKTNLGREYQAMQKIVEWINDGCNTPDLLNDKIKLLDYEQALTGKAWTEVVVNTMRTGFLGRMHDLRLIEREKHGNKTEYHATKEGKRLINLIDQLNDKVTTHV